MLGIGQMRLTFTDHASHPHQPITRHVLHNISRADFTVLEILPDFKGIVNPGSKMASCSRRFGISYWGRLEDLYLSCGSDCKQIANKEDQPCQRQTVSSAIIPFRPKITPEPAVGGGTKIYTILGKSIKICTAYLLWGLAGKGFLK